VGSELCIRDRVSGAAGDRLPGLVPGGMRVLEGGPWLGGPR
jgi:hypothetical protein